MPYPSINWYNVHGVKTMVPEYGLGKRVLWNLSFSVDKDSIQSNLWTIKRIKPRTVQEVINSVSDIDICALIEYHNRQKRAVTISATKPEGRFGALHLDEQTHEIKGFKEKARADQNWVNIGFMVMEPSVFDYLGDGSEMLETGPFERLAEVGQMDAYFHEGFWSPMDNIHDWEYLDEYSGGYFTACPVTGNRI